MSEAKTIPAKYIFLDVVGFTHDRSVEAQSDIMQVLNGIVENTIKEHGIPKANVMFLPASDGICIALLNIESPYDIHLSIALSIIREVHRHSAGITNKMRKFEVHVGINSNTDNLITDINGNQNIAGAGVNLASLLKSMADGNQILVSESVFDALRYHEKYISSFKSFRAKIKQSLDLPVYQFSMHGFEGLNVSVPRSLQSSAKAEPQPSEQTFYPEAAPPKPVKADQSISAARVSETKPSLSQIQSSSKPVSTEKINPGSAKPEWVKNKTKTESLTFLEQAAPAKQNHSLLWAALILLMVGGTGFGMWRWLSQQPASNTAQTPANAASVATTGQPANSANSSTVVPSKTPDQTVAEKMPESKPNTELASKAAPRESGTANTLRPRSTAVPRQPAARPIVKRTVEQRPKPEAKPQVVKTNKPKSSKRVTLDDLIN